MLTAFKNINFIPFISAVRPVSNASFKSTTTPTFDTFIRTTGFQDSPVTDKSSTQELKKTKLETAILAKKYPLDYQYKIELAKDVGCDVGALRSVIGIQELNDILKNLKPENFSVGIKDSKVFEEKYKNVLNGKFKINIHTHSMLSDGKMTPAEILDQAVKYADKTDQTFVFSLNDHEILEGDQEIIETIAANPEKYKNIRFIPGVEFQSSYNNSTFKEPIKVDILAYGFNPYNKNINKMLDSAKEVRLKDGEDIIKTVNNWWDIKASSSEMTMIAPQYSKGECVRYHRYLEKYLHHKIKQHGLPVEYNSKADKLVQEREMLTSIPMPELVNTIKNSGYGEIGIAHPCRDDFTKTLKDNIKKDDAIEMDIMHQFLKYNADLGVKIAEINYQYPSVTIPKRIQNPEKVMEDTNNYCKELGFIGTGGIDCHENNIFSYKDGLTPEQIKQLTEK